ncbi:MAG: amidohydrolase family protein [bacterium]
MIIDAHSHLGDILYPGGGAIIWKRGVKKKILFDLVTSSEWGLHTLLSGRRGAIFYRLMLDSITRSERARNAAATLENMRKSMDQAGVQQTVCLPIPPYLTFEDLRKAAQQDPGIIPFTGVDFTRSGDVQASLAADVAAGARGLKLHPIIQKEPLNSRRTLEAAEAFAVHDLPVLFHCGVSSYYVGPEKIEKQVMANGEVRYARELVSAFPKVSFIAGHSGLFQVEDVMDQLGPFRNVSVDVSFQSPASIRKLLDVFGPERVLYASDWPWGNRLPAVRSVQRACRGDSKLESLLFHDNAARLLKL